MPPLTFNLDEKDEDQTPKVTSESGSVLNDFSAVPTRAAGDRRLRGLHFSILIAVCRAVNKITGISVISQGAISRRTGRHRSKICVARDDLIEWGYLEKLKRGRRSRGWFKVLGYRILYKEDHVPPAGDVDHVPPAGDKPMSPTEETDSYLSVTNQLPPSESLDGGDWVQKEVKQIVDAFSRLRRYHWPNESRKPASMSKLRGQAQAWIDRGCPAELAIEIIDRVMQKNVREEQHYAPNNLGFCERTMDSAITVYKNSALPI